MHSDCTLRTRSVHLLLLLLLLPLLLLLNAFNFSIFFSFFLTFSSFNFTWNMWVNTCAVHAWHSLNHQVYDLRHPKPRWDELNVESELGLRSYECLMCTRRLHTTILYDDESKPSSKPERTTFQCIKSPHQQCSWRRWWLCICVCALCSIECDAFTCALCTVCLHRPKVCFHFNFCTNTFLSIFPPLARLAIVWSPVIFVTCCLCCMTCDVVAGRWLVIAVDRVSCTETRQKHTIFVLKSFSFATWNNNKKVEKYLCENVK